MIHVSTHMIYLVGVLFLMAPFLWSVWLTLKEGNCSSANSYTVSPAADALSLPGTIDSNAPFTQSQLYQRKR